MPDKQLLHIVIGGELEEVEHVRFRDPSKIDLVGAYPTYEEALSVWRSKALATVDNALMRYFIIHAHKLLDPQLDGEKPGGRVRASRQPARLSENCHPSTAQWAQRKAAHAASGRPRGLPPRMASSGALTTWPAGGSLDLSRQAGAFP